MSVTQVSSSGLKDSLATRIDALRPELEQVSRDIYANPETAYEEPRAVGWLTELLKRHGFSVEVGVASTPTAFVATRREGDGPGSAFVSGHDALGARGHGWRQR